jgi:hypothetical protein
MCAYIIKFVCTSFKLLKTIILQYLHKFNAQMLMYLIIHVFIYALIMLSNSLWMIKIDRNMSEL